MRAMPATWERELRKYHQRMLVILMLRRLNALRKGRW